MITLAKKDFGGDIVGRPTDGSLPLIVKLKFSGQSEIPNLHSIFLIQEDVASLQVPMDDIPRMKVSQALAQPIKNRLHFRGRQIAAHLRQIT